MNIDKKEIQKRIGTLIHQKYEIEQELLSLQKQYSEIFKGECEQYIGKCYKQFIEDADEGDVKNTYYKVLDFYDDEDDGTQFWVLVVEDHDDDSDITASYIRKECINLLGHNKFFLRQLTPISDKEFIEAIDSVYDHLIDMSGKVPNKEAEHFELKCPNCDSIGPLVDLFPNIIDVEYTCEKCGCKYIAKFQHGECISIKEN